MNSILIVDDEKDNLEALNRLLRSEFEITSTTSPIEALKLIQKNDYSVVISDQRMPQMTGVDLFEKAKRFRPDTMRVLLTGYTDIDSVVEAINRGNIYRYIAKPWDPEDLKLTLRQADEAFQLRRALESQNTALESANEELKLALEDLTRLDEAKARFLSLISHELNTPLTVLTSFSDLLAEKKNSLPADAAKASEAISKASRRFSEIVSEVIAYVSLESDGSLRLQEVSISNVIRDLLKQLKGEADKRNLVVKCDSKGDINLRCDPEKMKLALQKLFKDAIQHAPIKSEVRVQFASNGEKMACSVWRSGEVLDENAFEPLVAAGNLMNHHQNLGLGLAICKLIVEGHGGQISVNSTKETGTLVELVLGVKVS
jgi:two-component system, sensor histidine kinase and response regulator